MTYDEYVAKLAALLVIPADDPRFTVLLPWIIEYAELSLYRDPDFDFLATRAAADTSSITVSGSRLMPVPAAVIVVERLSLITPENLADPSQGTRIPLTRSSQALIDLTWPVEADVAPPSPFDTYYAIRDQQTPTASFIIAPTPNGAYRGEVYGTRRPAPLTSFNQTTFLTLFLADLFMAKSMVIATGGVLKNFGSQADDPQMANSWKHIYDEQRRGVAVESMRQKAISSGWSEFPPAPIAPLARSAIPAPPAQPQQAGG